MLKPGAAATIALENVSLVLALGALAATPFGPDAVALGILAAMTGALCGGLLVPLLARAGPEVCGVASPTVVIYAALGADLLVRAGGPAPVMQVWAALSVAVVLTGALVALAGWLRLAEAVKFIPAPVQAGFVTGLGLLVIWSQLGPLLGLQGRLASYPWTDVLQQLRPAAVVVGTATAVVVWGWAKWTSRGSPVLVAVAVGTALHHLWGAVLGAEHLGPALGTVSLLGTEGSLGPLWSIATPGWLLGTAWQVLPYAAFLALQSVLHAALTSVSVAAVTGKRSEVSRSLKAQGLANVVSGLAGGLPVSTVAALTMQAARMKAGALEVAAAGVLLLLALAVGGDVLALIPVPVLAGVLIMGGLKLIDRWAGALALRLWRHGGADLQTGWTLLTVAVVAATFFFGSVPLALSVGAVLAMLLLVINLAEATSFGAQDASELQSRRMWTLEQAHFLVERRAAVQVFRPRGALFFGTADQLAGHLSALPVGTRFCVLDLARLTTLDATACQIISAGSRRLAERGGTTVIAGLDPKQPREQAFIALGLQAPDARTHWFSDLDRALEWVEAHLLQERWPELATAGEGAQVDRTQLAKGLSDSELHELQEFFVPTEHPAGPLFFAGDAGSSMYVVDRGFVEIQVRDPASGRATRLAAFGPGSIFGEVALLTRGQRSADAICLEPTRLRELRRDALAELAARSPALHTKLLANLADHLAQRLVLATGLVRAQQ